MAWTPISNTVPQYEEDGIAASGFYIKFYEAGTTTPTAMATDSTGATTLDKCELNTEGYPKNGSNAVFIPHIDRRYKIALFRNATDADNNNLNNAVWPVDNMKPVLTNTIGTELDEIPLNSDLRVDTIAELRNVEPDTDGQQISLLGHTLSDVGGGEFYYDASDTTSADNNGTIIVTTGGKRWKRIIGGYIAPEMFGLLLNSSSDQTSVAENTLSIASELSLPVIANNNFSANIDVFNIDVRISGDAVITPFSRSSSAFRATAEYNASVSVTSITTVVQTIAGNADSRVSKVVAAGNTLSIGDTVKVASEDVIPSVPVSDGTRQGEFATVTELSGDDVYLDRVLRLTYSTSPKIASISGRILDIDINVKSTTGNGTSGAALVIIRGFMNPTIKVNLSDNDGVGLAIHGCYGAKVDSISNNLTNNTSLGMFGYGVLESSSGVSNIDINQSGFSRHAYTTGSPGVSASMYDYGEPENPVVKGTASGCLSNAWDTHEQGFGVVFQNVEAIGCRSAIQSRSEGTIANNLKAVDCDFFVQVNESGSATKAELTIDSCYAVGVGKPFNLKTVDFSNPPKVVINGSCYIEYSPITTGAAIDSQADLEVNGSLKMIMTGGTDFNILAQRAGDAVINGSCTFDTTLGTVAKPFSVSDCDFTIDSDNGFIDLLSSSITRLFTASSAPNALLSNIQSNNIRLNIDLSQNLWFEYPFNTEQLTLENTANQVRSANFVFHNTADDGLALNRNTLSNVVYYQFNTRSGFDTLTSVPDGNFVGQKMFIDNADASGVTLNIPNTISNIEYSASIPVDSTHEFTWRGTYWA